MISFGNTFDYSSFVAASIAGVMERFCWALAVSDWLETCHDTPQRVRVPFIYSYSRSADQTAVSIGGRRVVRSLTRENLLAHLERAC